MQGNVLDFGNIQANGVRDLERPQSLGQTEWSLPGAVEREEWRASGYSFAR